MLRGLARLEEVELTAIVNVGDDEDIYGLHVSPDVDTVIYTLAEVEGRQGWGYADDSHYAMTTLERFPIDTWFRIGDRDLATHLFRTARLRDGWTLSQTITAQAAAFGIDVTVLPASDDRIRTELHSPGEGWLSFQDYFVDRHHAVEIDDVRFVGADSATPAPGVLAALEDADHIVIGPSNPPLSIWPTLAIPGVAEAIEAAERVTAVSPLFGGRPLKGPTDRIMSGLGLPAGTAGILAGYRGLLGTLFVDDADAADVSLSTSSVTVHTSDTRIVDATDAQKLAAAILFE